MSQSAPGESSDLLDDVGGSEIGALSGPSVADESDVASMAGAADEDDSAQGRVAARTQQGGTKADVSIAADRAKRTMARETAADARIAEQVRRFLANEANGYLEVDRTGPPDAPPHELGIMPQPIRHTELASAPVSQVLFAKFGGGTFRLIPRRADNSLADVDASTITVNGAPKFRTPSGRRWWARIERGEAPDDPVAPPEAQSGNMMQFMMQFIERDKERDRQRAEAEEQRRRHEAEERAREWKERQDEAKASRDRELAELKTQREKELGEAKAARDRDLEEFRARIAREEKAAKAQLDAQLETMKNESAFRLKQMELDAEADRERRKVHLDSEARRMETRETGGLGFEGLGEVRKMLAAAVGKAALKDGGLDEDEGGGEGIGGALADVLRSEGPELLRTAANVFLPKLANWIPGGTPAAPPPQVAHNAPRQLPPPSRLAPDAPVPETSTSSFADTPPAIEPDAVMPEVEAPPPTGAPTREVAGRAAAQYALGSVLQFIRPLGVLALAQPDPAEAWDTPVGDGGETLENLYRRMPKQARGAAATDWSSFMAAVKKASPADADLLADAFAQDGGAEWHAAFLAAGPWVPENAS